MIVILAFDEIIFTSGLNNGNHQGTKNGFSFGPLNLNKGLLFSFD